jgi:acetyl-CoA carboxylase carboxyl transferase subunit alpha
LSCEAICLTLRLVSDLKPKELIERRHERLASYGRFSDGKPR